MTKPGDRVPKYGQSVVYWCSLGEHFTTTISDKTKNITCCDECWTRLEEKRKAREARMRGDTV